jgi:Matrixin
MSKNISIPGRSRGFLIALLTGAVTIVASGIQAPDARASACDNPEYHSFFNSYGQAVRWSERTYQYRANVATMPNGTDARRMITQGHHSFDDTVNDCGRGDQNNFNTSYAGTCAACGFHNVTDNTNAIDFGNVGNTGCGAAVLACTALFSNSNGKALEADQRYATGYYWHTYTSSPPATYYDLWSAAAHESGHALGLNHADSEYALTMYKNLSAGDAQHRTLGRGDIRGLRGAYPSNQPRSGAVSGDTFCTLDGCVPGSNNTLNGDTDAVLIKDVDAPGD